MKKLLFVIVMTLFMPCATIWAANGYSFTATTVEGVEMKFVVLSEDDMTCKVCNNSISTNTSGTVTIPASANGYAVVEISTFAFQGCSNIEYVIIPNTINKISEWSFYNLKVR